MHNKKICSILSFCIIYSCIFFLDFCRHSVFVKEDEIEDMEQSKQTNLVFYYDKTF